MKRWIAFILALMFIFTVSVCAFAEEDEDETQTETQTTTEPTLTLVQPTYPPETSSMTQTEEPAQEVQPPVIRISRQELARKPKYGESFSIVVVVQNFGGKTAIKTGRLSLTPSDGLILDEKSASLMIKPLSPGDVGRVTVHLKVDKEAASADQALNVVYDYAYQTPEGSVTGQAEEKLLIPVTIRPASETTTGKPANATPNIIVSAYDFGGRVSAGDTFTLSLQFRNTSTKLAAENIVMSVETGDAISITSASNTYFYNSLAPQSVRRQNIPMRVSPNADAQGGRIEISFKYEYVDGGMRSDASASERLSIPITIPDRFIVTRPETGLLGIQNEELTVSLPFVNKSRVQVGNVTAELIYDENRITCEQPLLNLGNFESGKSGTIDFFFTPTEPGDGSVTVRLTYENELAEEKTMEIPISFSVDPMMMDSESDGMIEDENPEENERPGWLIWVIIGGVAVVLVVVIIIRVRVRKKKKSSEDGVAFDWDIPQNDEVNTHETK